MTTKSYITDPKGHEWALYDGEVNSFAMDAEFHNGPRCVNCGYSFCEHCKDEIKPCEKPKMNDSESVI
jgi:hypothetical protein